MSRSTARRRAACGSGSRTDEAVAQEHAERRSLLTALDANGFFDGAGREPDARRLDERGLAVLAAYRRGALELLAYLDSPERRERLPGGAAGPVLGAPVSVDWFRHAVAPQRRRAVVLAPAQSVPRPALADEQGALAARLEAGREPA